MGGHRAPEAAGAVRGVEDRGVVLGPGLHVRRRGQRIGRGELLVPLDPQPRRLLPRGLGPGEEDDACSGPTGPSGGPPQPLPVHQEHLGPAVVEDVGELLVGPPRIGGYGDDTGQLGGPEGDLPRGNVPRRHHGPVPGAQPVALAQEYGEGGGGGEELPVGAGAFAVDQERRVPMGPGGLHELPQRTRAVGILRYAPLGDDHRVRCARRGEGRLDPLDPPGVLGPGQGRWDMGHGRPLLDPARAPAGHPWRPSAYP